MPIAAKVSTNPTAVIFTSRLQHLNSDLPGCGPDHLNRHVSETTQSDSIHLERSFSYNSYTREEQISKLPLTACKSKQERENVCVRERERGDSNYRCDSAKLIALFSLRVLELAEVVPLTPVTSASLFKLIG
ncbi:unnamed protein product [Leuciscus chuanchicus]